MEVYKNGRKKIPLLESYQVCVNTDQDWRTNKLWIMLFEDKDMTNGDTNNNDKNYTGWSYIREGGSSIYELFSHLLWE